MATLKTLTVYPSGYISDDYAYASVENIENGYNSADNTTYATINLTTGSGAETYIYYTFDLSAIPDSAVITGVSCSAKVTISSTYGLYISSRTMQLYSGTTAKGSSADIPSRGETPTITAGDWTRDELTDCRLKLYAKRGSSSTTTKRYIRFYGATLTIEYVEVDIIPIVGNTIIGGITKEIAGGYCNISGVWKQIMKSYSNINGVWKPTYKMDDVPMYTWKKYSITESTSVSGYKMSGYTVPGYSFSKQYDVGNSEDENSWEEFYNTYLSNANFYSQRSFNSSTGAVTYSSGGRNSSAYLYIMAGYVASSKLYTSFPMSGTYDGKVHVYIRGVSSEDYIMVDTEQVVQQTTTTQSQGSYIEDVTSSDYNAYPENGVQDGYWYVRQ